MELKEGMYLRTNLGIAKIISLEKKYLGNEFLLDKEIIDTHEDYYTNCMYDYRFYLEQIIKTSYNIIDLIEEGDYVNGYKITRIQEIDEYYLKRILYSTDESCDEFILMFNNDNIKSIVTKEQFESMSYRIGE